MDVSDLRLLETVVRRGSMSSAALELHTVQSNVTARVRALEEELGTSLFERNNRGVLPTAAATRLLPYAHQIARLLEDAAAAARDEGPPRGPLRIGSMETTAAYRLPELLVDFSRNFPEVGLRVTTSTTNGLLEQVLAFELDGAFVAGPVQSPLLTKDAIFEEELVLLTAPNFKSFAAIQKINAPRILVFRLGCSYRQRLETFLAQRGMRPAEPMEFGSLEAIIGCVAAGIGISMLPRVVVQRASDAGHIAIHTLPRSASRVKTVFVTRKDRYRSRTIQAFLQLSRRIKLP